MFKFSPEEIKQMEKMVDEVDQDNKAHPCISGGGVEIREVEFNGYKWMITCMIKVIPDEDDED